MPSLDDFREKLKTNADDAMAEYSILIDGESLDYTLGAGGKVDYDDFKVVNVVFEYKLMDGQNVIYMRAKTGGGGRKISYLPWKSAKSGAVAKATLDGKGPSYFLTSQLDGCRFTLQYHGTDRKTVTVLHLAGDHGGPDKSGSEKRDILEDTHLSPPIKPKLRRRFSIGNGAGKFGRAYRLSRSSTKYYDGGKATVFGYRNNAGAWVFYGLDIDKRDGNSLLNLGTGDKVIGSIDANAEK